MFLVATDPPLESACVLQDAGTLLHIFKGVVDCVEKQVRIHTQTDAHTVVDTILNSIGVGSRIRSWLGIMV